MRKQQKEQILEMLKALSRANDEIKKYLERNNTVVAADLFVKEQETVINIGNLIESYEGEGFVTVSYLEEYCEVLFQSHEDIASNPHFNPNNICKKLNKQLIKIENSVKNDIRVKKEVVFFPYKASMWDSLESVYLKAKEDPECDAYCVPIPYYDIKPDHTFGQMHYEGLEYPKNIEIIDFRKYDLEERRPDIVYIHNPYDNWNLVTSVDPKYYSSNLKEYTDELVYIPYFVLQEIEPDNQAAIDGMKHFIWTPGVINADKVIVQSEKMKQIYVNEYIKAATANGLTGKHVDRDYLNKKILGLGSPKIDKVLNTKREDLDIPPEWLEKIVKPDGSWKKIIFYNTSVGALLENDQKMIEKIKDVLRAFKENKDEVTLLWRPHPLIKATIESMRPKLWEEYDNIVINYLAEDWGIYDDTADMDRAIILSDAYYGDGSSVVQLYQQTKKSAVIQDANITLIEKDNYFPIMASECMIKIDDFIYYVPIEGKDLRRINWNSMEDEHIVFLDEEFQHLLYMGIVEFKEKLYLLPRTADRIAIINPKTKEIKYIEFRKDKFNNRGISTFLDYYMSEEKLYLIPCHYENIVVIDLKNDNIEQIPIGDAGEVICSGKSVIFESNIFIPDKTSKRVLKFEVNQKTFTQVNNIAEVEYRACHISNGKLILIPCSAKDPIQVLDMETQTVEHEIIISDIDIQLFYTCLKENLIFITTSDLTIYYYFDINTNEIGNWNLEDNTIVECNEKWKENMNILKLVYIEDKPCLVNGLTMEMFEYSGPTWKKIRKKSKTLWLEGMAI